MERLKRYASRIDRDLESADTVFSSKMKELPDRNGIGFGKGEERSGSTKAATNGTFGILSSPETNSARGEFTPIFINRDAQDLNRRSFLRNRRTKLVFTLDLLLKSRRADWNRSRESPVAARHQNDFRRLGHKSAGLRR
jgi:hypothetical protein